MSRDFARLVSSIVGTAGRLPAVEAESHVEDIEEGPVLDSALLAALQRVEHYEISACGTVAAFAEATGNDGATLPTAPGTCGMT